MMADESIPLKIRQLIDSKDATNNFLALTLLRSQLGLDFTSAFAQLTLLNVQEFMLFCDSQYVVSILDYNISFWIDHKWNETSKYPYLSIERKVQQGTESLSAYEKNFSILYFESENERDIYEALIALPNLGEGLESLFF